MADCEALPPGYAEPPAFTAEADGCSLRFYPRGPDRLEALLALIGGAHESLRLAFYIFAKDESATKVRDALVAAAVRGVGVHLMVDGFGAVADDRFFAPLVEAGGAYCRFMPRWGRRYLIRNHQKLVVADGKVAMLGGFNIEDAYFAKVSDENGWVDLALTIDGPAAASVAQWFDRLEAWARRPKAKFRDIRRSVRRWDCGSAPVQVLVGGPDVHISSWARCVSEDLLDGHKLDIMMAYFSPPPRLLKRIRRIAAKGQTRLLLPAKSDNGATIGAARALYRKLLHARSRIWEFQPCRLHTKLIVLDDTVYVGSANLDMRSLYLNLEIVLKVKDAALADQMRDFVSWHLPVSREVTAASHAAQATLWNRFRWRVSWFLVAVLDYSVSRRLNLGL